MRNLIFILALWCAAVSGQVALQVPPPLNQLQMVGEGRLRYFGFHVYDASTWSSTNAPINSVAELPTPFALQIRYAREIAADDLVSKTQDAWRDLQLVLPSETQWLQSLSEIWPDVKQNDVIVCYVDESGEAIFYINGALGGRITSRAFTEAFLAIWLDEKAEFGDLRKQLIGVRRSE